MDLPITKNRPSMPGSRPRLKPSLAPVLSFLSLSCLLCSAADWPQWRGPNFDGSSPETGVPGKFSRTRRVQWVKPMPGSAGSTPVISGTRVFLSSTDEARKVLLAMCLDRRTGETLWQVQIAPRIARDSRSNFAAPSAATDGTLVVFFFSSGELAVFDLEGTKLWEKNIQRDYGEFAFLWTFSSSPLLYQGRLYLQVLQRNEPVDGRGRTDGPNDSYLLALDPKTGRELWKRIRPSEARGESLEAFTTPIPFTHQGRTELLVAGGDCLTGHDPETGHELWRWGTWNSTRISHWRLVPSPVGTDGAIIVCAPKRGAGLRHSTRRPRDLGRHQRALEKLGSGCLQRCVDPLGLQQPALSAQ